QTRIRRRRRVRSHLAPRRARAHQGARHADDRAHRQALAVTTSRVVQVDIQGQRYAVRSELDEQYVVELATYVDERLRRASSETSADQVRVAVLAALNIADELFRARMSGQSLEQRTVAIERLVDAALEESAPIRAVR